MPPDGLALKGNKGTASISWKRGPSGKVMITAMNGVTLGEAMEPMGEAEEPGEDDPPMMG